MGGSSVSGESSPLSLSFITNDLRLVIGISLRYHSVVYYVDKLPAARQARLMPKSALRSAIIRSLQKTDFRHFASKAGLRLLGVGPDLRLAKTRVGRPGGGLW
jgi:hypothetical protein